MMEKLLVVDDNGELRKIVLLTLSYGKYKRLQAENGEQALEIVEHEQPDIVLLDIMMPGLDGLEVCRRIRANTEIRQPFIVMLTALGQQVDRTKGLLAGADYYMVKPFRPTDLILVIEGVRTGKKSAEDVAKDVAKDGPAIDWRVSDQK